MSHWTQLQNHLLFLALPKHDQTLLPVPTSEDQSPVSIPTRAMRFIQSIADRRENMRIVFEFRDKLRTAEELISKLAYSLREIQGAGIEKSKTDPLWARLRRTGASFSRK